MLFNEKLTWPVGMLFIQQHKITRLESYKLSEVFRNVFHTKHRGK